MIRRVFLLLPAAAVLLSGCPQPEVVCGLAPVFEVTETLTMLSIDPCTGAMAIGTEAELEALVPAAPASAPPLAWTTDEIETSMNQGRFTFEGWFNPWVQPDHGEFVSFDAWQGGTDDVVAQLAFGPGPQGSIHVRLDVLAEVDRVSVAFGCVQGQRFYGTGARPDGTDHTGKEQLLYAAEQGIGQVDYDLDDFDFIRGRVGDTYFPVPWTVTDDGVGFAIGGTPMARMYLCGETEPDVVRFETWSNNLDLYVFPSGSPRQAVSDWTIASGPPAPAPDWSYGPWIAVQRGTDALLAEAAQLRELGIPVTALWAQDWIGGRDSIGGYDLHYHWEWDEEQYPELPAAIEQLHADGFAFLGYFNPFITDDFVEWDEALEGGYLPETPDGQPYEFSVVNRYGSQVDLDDEEARAWAKSYLEAAPAMGQDGWMCDFAEWLPLDATVGDGLSGMDRHNAYPIQWQELNMEVLNEALGVGNGLCFARSGWAGTQALAPITWGGDQETSWLRDDGLPSAREIGVGLGLSGIGRYGSDIAGFSSVWSEPSTRELYWRWIEMSAFEPVFRTHDGLAEEGNWHWSTDLETIHHFARFANIHMRLLPYLKVLDREYMGQGLPMMRHTILVESGEGPAWEALRDAPDQHFLGDHLLVAPVVTEGASSRTVVLPTGRWYGLEGAAWEVQGEPTEIEVPAPLGTIPVFGRAGFVLPLGAHDIETAYPEDNIDVVGAADRADTLDLVLFTGADGSTQTEGITWTFASTETALGGPATLDGEPLDATCAEGWSSDCQAYDDPATGTAFFRVDWADGPRTLAGDGWSLEVDDGRGISGSVTVRYPPN
jgi:sulfoquinovosidase